MRLSSHAHDGVATIVVEGDVDVTNAALLRDASMEALGDGVRSLVVDCTALTFIDSSGLSALIEAYRAADVQWGTVTIRNPPPMARRLLEITGLDKSLIVEDV